MFVRWTLGSCWLNCASDIMLKSLTHQHVTFRNEVIADTRVDGSY